MLRFNTPNVGDVITITTRYHESHLFTAAEWRENTYSDVEVLMPEPWFGPNDIKIAGNDRMPFRVINMSNVCDMSDVVPAEVTGKSGIVEIAGSGDKLYSVTLVNGDAISCTCPHHMYRKAFCKHMKQAVTDYS